MLDKPRRRLISTLFVGNALASISFIGAITVATLVAKSLTGRDDLSGVPSMVATFGAAFGAFALTALSHRVGRRPAFILGYTIAAVGTAICIAAIMAQSFALFIIGMAVVGFGRSVSQLSRYAAGDLVSPEHRGTAISIIVWAATIGSVAGPLLIAPSGRLLHRITGEEFAGPFAVGAVGFFVASLLMVLFLRPEPLSFTEVRSARPIETTLESSSSTAYATLLVRPNVVLSLTSLAVSQLVMVMVMTMTPLHIKEHDHGLGMVGWVMMAHTLGMFAIAPLTGTLVDRIGARRVIGIAMVLLASSSLLAATATDAQPATLLVGLFFLGVGWNFGFVAGSTALTEGIESRDYLRLQGLADTLTWIAGGFGAITSGLIVSASSYPILGIAGAALTAIPLLPLLHASRQMRRL